MNNWKVLPLEWNECCIICGDAPEINTEREDMSLLHEDDEIRCSNPECRTQAGVVLSERDNGYIANLHWIEETCKNYEGLD